MDKTTTTSHCGGLFFNFRRILKHQAVTFPVGISVPQKLAQSNLHRKAVSKRFFRKFKILNLNFQRFFGYITTFLKTVFLNAEFHNGPTRYLDHTRDLRRSHKKLLTVPAAPSCTCLPCFLFAYVAEIWASGAPLRLPRERTTTFCQRIPRTKLRKDSNAPSSAAHRGLVFEVQ